MTNAQIPLGVKKKNVAWVAVSELSRCNEWYMLGHIKRYRQGGHSMIFIRNFIRWEASSGVFLMFIALLALIVDNSPWSASYQALLDSHWRIHWGPVNLDKSLLHWVNEGLMSVFFLLVGLEVKREILDGELCTWRKASLPVYTAVGGMLVPALVYLAVNLDHPQHWHGWAIPVATDIAFALGILLLLGKRVPTALRAFLTALAIFDDMGAIMVIAIFYADTIHWVALLAAGGAGLGLLLLNRCRAMAIWPYLLLGLLLWLFVLYSGLHATLAGVLLAMAFPNQNDKAGVAPAHLLEKRLLPWVAWFVLPVFALTNAGVSFAGVTWQQLWHPIPVGIVLGLVLGKPLGIVLSAWCAVRAGWSHLPSRMCWWGLFGVACVCGVGFTMSLFIGALAFDEQVNALAELHVRGGVLCGSLISGILGYLVLRLLHPRPHSSD